MASGLDFVTVSADEIRFKMFSSQMSLTAETSEVWHQTVNLTRKLLLEEAFRNRWSVVVDQMITTQRVRAVEEISRQFPESVYRIKKVYLQADTSVLQKRVVNRVPVGEKYTGTLGELNASLEKYGTIDISQFD